MDDLQGTTAATTPLAACALWAVRDLAAKLNLPGSESSDIINQVIFAAQALKAYRTEVEGRIPPDFLPKALSPKTDDQQLTSSVEELLVGVTVVIAANGGDCDPSERSAVTSKICEWLASVCMLRRPRAGVALL